MSSQRAQLKDGRLTDEKPATTKLTGPLGNVALFIILYFWSLFSLDAFRAAQHCPYRRVAEDGRSQRAEDWGIGYRGNESRRAPRGNTRTMGEMSGPSMPMPGPAVPCRGCGGGAL